MSGEITRWHNYDTELEKESDSKEILERDIEAIIEARATSMNEDASHPKFNFKAINQNALNHL